MNILVLGGTAFLGPDIVEPLLERGHAVSIFNRGKTNPGLFPKAEKLVGDRNSDLKSLEGRSWDVVIDVPATHPKWVRRTCELLSKTCKSYLFVSTISVYNDFANPIDEQSPTFAPEPDIEDMKQVNNMTYGPMKRRCEELVMEFFPKTGTIVRPGLIVGPDDPTDRFTYWPARIDRGGDVLAPMPADQPVQFVDSRDLGRFIVSLVEDGHSGTFNATGPAAPMSMVGLLHGCRAATSADVRFTWVDEAFLLEQGVGPFMEMPLWVPGDDMKNFMTVDCSKARSVGLNFRPLAETARDTMAWVRTLPADRKWTAGLAAEREQAVLKAWRERPASK
jgi:2'-hydroxyisoflavone reductase